MKKLTLILGLLVSTAYAPTLLLNFKGGAAPPPAVTCGSYSNLVLWLDGQDNTKITQSGGLITVWTDKSGLSHSFTASGTGRPTLTSNAINSFQAPVFDGANTFMTTTSFSAGTTYTAFIVTKFNTLAARGWYLGNTGSIEMGQFFELYDGTNSADFSATGISTGTNYVMSMSYSANPTSATLKRNGTTMSQTAHSGAAWNAFTITNLGRRITNAFFVNGPIGEICVYTDTKNGTDETAIIAALKTKWGIP